MDIDGEQGPPAWLSAGRSADRPRCAGCAAIGRAGWSLRPRCPQVANWTRRSALARGRCRPAGPHGRGPSPSTASGSSSVAAVLNPVNPSMATTSTRSRHCWWSVGQPMLEGVLATSFDHVEQPGRAGLVAIGVRSMITVMYLSPRRVWRQRCSSTPITATPSNRAGSPGSY